MYLVKTPRFIQRLFPNFTWQLPATEKVLHLTFDDGPIPKVTPWVLEQLKKYNAKGTFFCVGDNVRKHPQVFEQVLAGGHAVGNHTYHHLSGWSTDNSDYVQNVQQCKELVASTLFRPPYGRLTPKQAQLLQQHYRIIMWDVLSGDFDQNLSEEDCLQNVLKNAQSGSIIVFHDSLKAQQRLEYVLPRTLEHFSKAGYRFATIDVKAIKQEVLRHSA